MQFRPFVFDRMDQQIPVSIVPMVQADAELTNLPPVWQTSWTSKTTELARHYEKDFGAVPLPAFGASAPRYLIADEAAKRIFFTYLV